MDQAAVPYLVAASLGGLLTGQQLIPSAGCTCECKCDCPSGLSVWWWLYILRAVAFAGALGFAAGFFGRLPLRVATALTERPNKAAGKGVWGKLRD